MRLITRRPDPTAPAIPIHGAPIADVETWLDNLLLIGKVQQLDTISFLRGTQNQQEVIFATPAPNQAGTRIRPLYAEKLDEFQRILQERTDEDTPFPLIWEKGLVPKDTLITDGSAFNGRIVCVGYRKNEKDQSQRLCLVFTHKASAA